MLLTSIAPRPIGFVSTTDLAGNINLSPFSFYNVFSSNPPILIFSPARRGRDSTTKHSYENVKEVPEAVVNVVNYPIVQQMSLASTEYDKGVNEFVKSGLTEAPSDTVRPPRVAESPLSFECRVEQVMELGQSGGAGNLVICNIQIIHLNEKYLDENGKLDTGKLDLVARMGGDLYCRAIPEAMFELHKPLKSKGIGVDALPMHVRQSKILTGNDLARLGNMEKVPNVQELSKSGTVNYTDRQEQHLMVLRLLEKGKAQEALQLCFM